MVYSFTTVSTGYFFWATVCDGAFIIVDSTTDTNDLAAYEIQPAVGSTRLEVNLEPGTVSTLPTTTFSVLFEV